MEATKTEMIERINKAIQQTGCFGMRTQNHSSENSEMETLSHEHPTNLYFIKNEKSEITDWNVVEI